MADITYAACADILNVALDFYVKGAAFKQTQQERPLLAALESGKATFSGGKEYISTPIQGRFMESETGFFAGYSGGQELTFQRADNVQRAKYKWYEVHAGIMISWSELKQDGITITDRGTKVDHGAVTRLTGILENRLDDFSESWARKKNSMLWADGSQDSKQVPGLQAILTEAPAVGTTGGLNRADPEGDSSNLTYWRHQTRIGATGNSLQSSRPEQSMTKGIRSALRQLTRYGARNFIALSGSAWLEKLEDEVHEKGVYTQEGFVNNGKNDIGMSDIWLRGMGKFSYDPTMDDIGWNSRCVVFDKRRLRLRPMEGEEDKLLNPERPYNYAMFFRSMTWTGALECYQLNACAIWEVV